MTAINILVIGMIIISFIAALIIVFRSRADIDFLQEVKDGKIVNSTTRIVFLVGNALSIWYVVYQVTNRLEVSVAVVAIITGISNGTKLWKDYNDAKKPEQPQGPGPV